MQVTAYAHTHKPLLKSLPKLLEKVYESGGRAVVVVDEHVVDEVDSLLWTYTPLAFLPHGSRTMGSAEHQPIWITATMENPNKADICVLVDQAAYDDSSDLGFARILDLYNAGDEASQERFHKRCATYQQKRFPLTIWADSPTGSWEKQQATISLKE